MGERARDLFRSTFGREPRVVTSAPGRVNLIGEHTDYNGGQVLPIAIGHRTCVAMAPAGPAYHAGRGASRTRERGRPCRAVSAQLPNVGSFDLSSAETQGAWWDYVHGSLREVDSSGVPLAAVDVAVVSDVPVGVGLSSSAALEVSTVLAALVCAEAGLIERWDSIATLAHRAETRFVGVPCGIMDQTVCAYASEGHALRVWCDTGRKEPVPIARDVLIVDTAMPRSLRESAFEKRQRECQVALAHLRKLDPGLPDLAHAPMSLVDDARLDPVLHRRARHVVSENHRVEAFVQALVGGEADVGPLLLASHQSLRHDYECSSPELNWVVEFAMASPGVEGARLTGAGWGGCAIVIGSGEALRGLPDTLVPAFTSRWRRPPGTWLTRAETGLDVEWAAGMDES